MASLVETVNYVLKFVFGQQKYLLEIRAGSIHCERDYEHIHVRVRRYI